MLFLLVLVVAIIWASAEDLFEDIKADREDLWL